ncbi:UNVERIFIED_CONTAM: hypothetical protein PYX00_011551 [Menopon gallinae]|uniref:Uncharacterized protein n=1 Tax=Menopon gallinae TaxID=328185 RepID=A0AAW2H899_9NEOP
MLSSRPPLEPAKAAEALFLDDVHVKLHFENKDVDVKAYMQTAHRSTAIAQWVYMFAGLTGSAMCAQGCAPLDTRCWPSTVCSLRPQCWSLWVHPRHPPNTDRRCSGAITDKNKERKQGEYKNCEGAAGLQEKDGPQCKAALLWWGCPLLASFCACAGGRSPAPLAACRLCRHRLPHPGLDGYCVPCTMHICFEDIKGSSPGGKRDAKSKKKDKECEQKK